MFQLESLHLALVSTLRFQLVSTFSISQRFKLSIRVSLLTISHHFNVCCTVAQSGSAMSPLPSMTQQLHKQWCSPEYLQVYGVYPLIFQSALHFSKQGVYPVLYGLLKKIAKLRVYPLLQGPLHH